MALPHPNPVPDWGNYGTLYWYTLKMLISVGSTAVNLFSGVSDYFRLSKNKEKITTSTLMKNINHPGPSNS